MKLLLCEDKNFSKKALGILKNILEVHKVQSLSRNDVLAVARDMDIIWVRLGQYIDAEFLNAANKLKFIVSPTTGLNHIDLDTANSLNIRILSLKGEFDFLKNIRATAELTLGLILSLLRHIPSASAHTLNGEWDRDKFWGQEIYKKTIGIIGYGRLGMQVSKYLNSFDVRILVHDPYKLPDHNLFEFVSLNSLLMRSDIVTIHVDLNVKSKNFFSSDQFKIMKKGAYLINTSRGELLNEEALIHALDSGQLGGVALDVISDEYKIKEELPRIIKYATENNNVIITPHIGGCTVESMEKTEIFMAEKLCAVLSST